MSEQLLKQLSDDIKAHRKETGRQLGKLSEDVTDMKENLIELNVVVQGSKSHPKLSLVEIATNAQNRVSRLEKLLIIVGLSGTGGVAAWLKHLF